MNLIFLPISRLPRPLSGFHRLAIFVCVLIVAASVLSLVLGFVLLGIGVADAPYGGNQVVYGVFWCLGACLIWAFGRALFWLLTGQ